MFTIEASGIEKSFGKKKVLDGIDLNEKLPDEEND